MTIHLFSPILILLITVMFIKAGLLVGRIQEQTSYSISANSSSILIDSAYANTEPAAHVVAENKPASEPNKVPEAIALPPEKEPSAIVTKTNLMPNLTSNEMDLLKQLSVRREQLDKEQQNLTTRQHVLKATEDKIDKKVQELQKLQTDLEQLVQQYDKKEHARIMSLVKIYETMKPKDAAKIFNELEMPVLIRVVSNMKEVKLAPILATMNSMKARDLSIELAKQKSL